MTNHINILGLTALSLSLIAAAPKKNELAPITAPADGVMYPLPAIAMPDIPAGAYTETEDSPAVHLGKAWMKLADAQKLERSAATKQLYTSWQEDLRKWGESDMRTRKAHANFLTQYAKDLASAMRIYGEIAHTAAQITGSENGESGEGNGEDGIAQEVQQMIAQEDVERSYLDAACLVDPESCVPPDADNQQIVDEIAGLVAMLDAGGPSGELHPEALLKKAKLLERRAKLVMLLTVRAAHVEVLGASTPKDSNGKVSPMMLPVASAKERRAKYAPADPYRD